MADLVSAFGLADKKVLDIGAGRGYLQDVVADYTALNISPSGQALLSQTVCFGIGDVNAVRRGPIRCRVVGLGAGACSESRGGPAKLRYLRLTPNYDHYWMPDSDAVNRLDRYETALWFLSRGDQLIIRIHKHA